MIQRFGNGKVCGKRGGPTFLEAIFIDLRAQEKEQCPRGLAKCPFDASATKVQCVEEPDNDCPILDIVAYEANLDYEERYLGTTRLGSTFIQSADSLKYQLSYSKVQTSSELSAVIETLVTSQTACASPDQDQLHGS